MAVPKTMQQQRRRPCSWLFLMALLPATTIGESDKDDATPESEWYKRYPQYPQYCSTPEQMNTRDIPPLPDDVFSSATGEEIPETRLRHVTAVLSHGARTIASRESPCWDGFWENPETAIWDCPLTERVIPPTPLEIMEEEGGNAKLATDPIFMFQKNFDVVPNRNVLEGTCQLGQLMAQGYEQLVYVGSMLRRTYLYKAHSMDHPERMRLYEIIPGSEWSEGDHPWDEPNFYLRAEDSQPTMVSGQLVMQGLFGPELGSAIHTFYNSQEYSTVPVHTGDKSRDIVGGYPNGCPRMDRLRSEAEASAEFDEFYNSEESVLVRDFMERHLSHDAGLFDCLMTTVCTDRPLPDRFGIYNPHPDSWTNRISAFHAKNHSFHYQYNNNELSKLSMGPLWAEILEHIAPLLTEDQDVDDRARPPSKMSLYSGRDTTLMQLLSSLGVWNAADWPPYASMMAIEIHEMVDDNYDKSKYGLGFAFRLIYNGKILTSSVQGCQDDLCDAQVLLDHVVPIATRDIDCTIPADSDDGGSEGALTLAKSILSETAGIVLLLVVVTVSGLLGSVGAFFYLTGSLPTKEILPENVAKVVGTTTSPTSSNGRASAGIEPFEIGMSDANDPSDYED